MIKPEYYIMTIDCEIVMPIAGSAGYTISNTGTIRNQSGSVIKHHKISSGYSIVTFITSDGGRCTRLVHSLVAEAFLKAPDPGCKCVVHHIDGNRSNNVVTNLQYTTYSDNLKAAYRSNAFAEIEAFMSGLGGEAECQLMDDIRSGVGVRQLMQQYSMTRSMAVKIRRYFNVRNNM